MAVDAIRHRLDDQADHRYPLWFVDEGKASVDDPVRSATFGIQDAKSRAATDCGLKICHLRHHRGWSAVRISEIRGRRRPQTRPRCLSFSQRKWSYSQAWWWPYYLVVRQSAKFQ
jgi:hypothetical protein